MRLGLGLDIVGAGIGHNGGPALELPVNTVAPVVSGTAVVGQTLTCTAGTWTGNPTPTLTYQWYRGATPIGGETGLTYLLAQADAGNTSNIKCVESAVNDAGAADANSNVIAQILDAAADAYITATGELFPDALNTLVLGIKAASLWDNHIGSIKKAIGVPSLAASMIDLRNTAFNGTAVNTPGHSATTGWSFTKASSQYINSGWQVPATGSKATQNSVHVGVRVMASTVDGGSNMSLAYSNPYHLGFGYLFNGNVQWRANDSTAIDPTPATAIPGGWIGTRTTAAARALYKNGVSAGSDTQASSGVPALNLFIGARNIAGTPDNFSTSRVTLWHAGAGLDATQTAALDALFAAYALAAGEA